MRTLRKTIVWLCVVGAAAVVVVACSGGGDIDDDASSGGGSGTSESSASGAPECLSDAACKDDDDACNGTGVCKFGKCEIIDVSEVDDMKVCTVDSCDPNTGVVTHHEYTKEDLEDGDPCTIDFCTEGMGIVHGNCANCQCPGS